MVRLVVEAPLANDQVRASVFHAFNHVLEFRLFVFTKLLVLFNARDIELVLSLRAWRFEWASEDGEAGVLNGTGHARMRHVLVDENALDERGVSERAADFAVDLDEIKGDVFPLEVSYRHDCLHCNLGELLVFFRHTLNGHA